MIEAKEIERLIVAGLPGAQVQVFGDDGAHFEAIIVAEEFVGKPLLERHRMVYAALGDGMKARIHALSMKTWTPEENLRRSATN